jgi:hypothetical protein
MKSTAQNLFFTIALLWHATSAGPVQLLNTAEPRSNISISPGHGLPSLDELGLTATELLAAQTPPSAAPRRRQGLAARAAAFFPKCYKTNVSNMGAARMCQNFLNKIGSQECRATRDATWAYMCNATLGDIKVFVRAQPLSGVDTASSSCSDVAKGMDWIMDLCKTNPCQGDSCAVGGTNAAWKNGNLVIEVVGTAEMLSSS